MKYPNYQRGGFMTLLRGYRYLTSWPQNKLLAAVFPESRVCRATAFGLRLMPPFALFIIGWHWIFHGDLGPTIAGALFACSLPLQGLWWLGKRAVQPLPPSLLQWFYSVKAQLEQKGRATEIPDSPITYQRLADLLTLAFQQLDLAFLDEL